MIRAILFGSIATLLMSCTDAPTTGGAQDVTEPRFFIAQSLGPACTRDAQGRARSASTAKSALDRLDANSARYIADLRRSNSLTVNKDAYAANWMPILFNSYAAAAADDDPLARTIIDGLKKLAANGRYQNEPDLISWDAAFRLPACYSQGPETPCPTHTPRFVSRMYANLLVSAAVLDSKMTDQDRAVLLPWFDKGYRSFIQPEFSQNPSGIYDFANMGLARLAYAALKNDTGLARQELNERRRDFLKYVEASGYIDQNSYRGVRGFWYHTYGLDPALSYALIAREWGVDYFRDPTLGPRLRAAVDKTSLGITDYSAFRAVGNRGSEFSTDPNDTKAHVHQFALNLYPIAAREFGVQLPRDRRFEELSRLEPYSQTSGMLATCYYSGR